MHVYTEKEAILVFCNPTIHRIFSEFERLDICVSMSLFWYNRNAAAWEHLHTVSFQHDADYWRANIAGLLVNSNFASRLRGLRIHGLPLEETSSLRADVTMKKILASVPVYDESVLEIQLGIKGLEREVEELFRMRAQVKPTFHLIA